MTSPDLSRSTAFMLRAGIVVGILLMVAGLMEPCWVYTMERSEHFRRLSYAVATVMLIVVDLGILSAAMQSIGAGVSYAV